MARTSNDFYILASVQLDTSNIQSQLTNFAKGITINIDSSKVKETSQELDKTTEATNRTTEATNDLALTYQEASLIMDKCVQIIGSMVEQVFELNSALIEFQKVSDLSGSSLDEYVNTLNSLGDTVGRTGKPKCLTPDVRIVNVH